MSVDELEVYDCDGTFDAKRSTLPLCATAKNEPARQWQLVGQALRACLGGDGSFEAEAFHEFEGRSTGLQKARRPDRVPAQKMCLDTRSVQQRHTHRAGLKG